MRRTRNRWLFLLVLIAGLGSFTAVWYGALRDTGSGAPDYGGQYVEGMTGAPARVNPLFAGNSAVDQTLVSLIFSGLTRLDDRGQPFPGLAETWNVSDDGLVYTFTLRNGLVWPDGAPLTPDDVLFTYDLLRNPALKASPAPPDALAGAKISKLDARSLRIELSEPFAPLPAYLTTGILPQHLLKDASAQTIGDSPFNQRPVGAGPFRLVELTPDHAVLEANSVYHAGMPYIQRLELRFFRDSQALLTALQARELDGAYFTTGIAEASEVELEHDAGLRRQVLSTGETTFVYLNLDNAMFSDRRVRQALLYALDRNDLAALVYGGLAQKAESPLVNGMWSEMDSLRRYGTDPRTARLLLDEAGWKLTATGDRERNGVKLAFELTTTPDAIDVAVANAIAAQWKQVGVNVTVLVKGSTAIVRDVLGPRAFDALLFEQPAAPDPDPYIYWHSSQATVTGYNLASLENDRVDQLLSQAHKTPQNLKREEIYSQFQELFAQEVPSLPLYSSTALYAQRLVRDARPGMITQPGDRFWQVEQWHVKIEVIPAIPSAQARLPVVALLTDFGLADPYVGVMKGVILSRALQTQLVDLTHEVPPQSVLEGAFLLETAWRYFPAGTIFVVVIDPGVGSVRRRLAVQAQGMTFIGPDNGCLSSVLSDDLRGLRENDQPYEARSRYPDAGIIAVSIENRAVLAPNVSATFEGRDVFGPAAGFLAGGGSLQDLGPAVQEIEAFPAFRAPAHRPGSDGPLLNMLQSKQSYRSGVVIHIDTYGNLITDIRAADIRGEARFVLRHLEVPLVRTYAEAPGGNAVAIAGSSGFIEVAVPNGSAADRLGASVGTEVDEL